MSLAISFFFFWSVKRLFFCYSQQNIARSVMSMVKRVVIEVLLVDESGKRLDEEIKEEILEELSKNLHVIPWAAKIEKVTVTNG